jgi:tape measure domain-containing protein
MARLVVDEVVTKYTMDPDGYVRGVTTIKQKNADLIKSHDSAFGKAGLGGLKSHLSGFLSAAGSIVSTIGGIAAAAVGLGAAIAGAGAFAFKEYASFDSLNRSLIAVEGGADRAKLALDDLKNIAKAPGVDFEESVRGYLGLRRQGLGEDFSKRALVEFGNANAYGGGNKQTFEQIMRAVGQIAAKDYLQGDELLQLNEAGVGAQKMIRNKFGTSDTEELKRRGIGSQQVLAGLVDELGKLERVGDGPQNQLDNFFSALQFGVINAGAGLAGFGAGLSGITTAIEQLTDANVFSDAIKEFVTQLNLIPGSTEGVADALLRITSKFVGFGTYMKNFADGAGIFFDSVKSFFSKFLRLIPGMGPMLDALGTIQTVAGNTGFGQFWNDAMGNTAADDFYNAHKSGIKPKKDEPFKAALDKATTAPAPSEQPALPVLRRIADNTEPLKAIMDKVLGGGSLTPTALNRQDLSDLHTGRASGLANWERKVLEGIHEGMAIGAISFSPIGNRREA